MWRGSRGSFRRSAATRSYTDNLDGQQTEEDLADSAASLGGPIAKSTYANGLLTGVVYPSGSGDAGNGTQLSSVSYSPTDAVDGEDWSFASGDDLSDSDIVSQAVPFVPGVVVPSFAMGMTPSLRTSPVQAGTTGLGCGIVESERIVWSSRWADVGDVVVRGLGNSLKQKPQGSDGSVTGTWPTKYRARFWSRRMIPYQVAAIQFFVGILTSPRNLASAPWSARCQHFLFIGRCLH